MSAGPEQADADPDRSAYSEASAARLLEMQSRLEAVKLKLRVAVTQRQIELTEQLRKAELQADSLLQAAEEHLKQLDDADDESWRLLKSDIENAWEELAQSIKRLIARFS